jgi:hypothetical protein
MPPFRVKVEKMSKKIDYQELYCTIKEKMIRNDFVKLFHACPIPDKDLLQNLGLFFNSKNLARILFLNHIYQQIVDVHGVVIDFGTRWGQNLSLFAALRGIYEPFNRMRKIVSFDTFTGFLGVDKKDNSKSHVIYEGGLSCTDNYEMYLKKIMEYQEQDNPMSHIKKFEIRKGNASIEIKKYLREFPETIVALAFFDFDMYKPTKDCLKAIKNHLVKGSLLAFDELNDHDFPGETTALNEVFGLREVRLKRFSYTSRISYFIVE